MLTVFVPAIKSTKKMRFLGKGKHRVLLVQWTSIATVADVLQTILRKLHQTIPNQQADAFVGLQTSYIYGDGLPRPFVETS